MDCRLPPSFRAPTPARVCAFTATFTLVLLTGGCGNEDEATPAAANPVAASTVTGTLSAASQTGSGSSVVVKRVSIQGSTGWVALHADLDGAPGAVLGFVEIPEGTSRNVKIVGEKKLAAGVYWPMLHTDAGKIGTYEPRENGVTADVPVMADGKPVMMKIAYRVKK